MRKIAQVVPLKPPHGPPNLRKKGPLVPGEVLIFGLLSKNRTVKSLLSGLIFNGSFQSAKGLSLWLLGMTARLFNSKDRMGL